jgi:hypothetical protein
MSENEEMDDSAEADLAWELVEIADSCILEGDRTKVCTAIGAGDCGAAIDTLLETMVRASILLPPALVAKLVDWLSAYAHHPHAPRLHEVLNAIGLSGQSEINSTHNM